MKILKKQVLRGPNIWSNYRKKLIQVRLDLEDMEEYPTNKISGFKERLERMLPSMVEHECSEGRRGGFLHRVEEGTWLGHVMEHIALELQTLAGMETGFGRTRSTKTRGVYNVVFNYTIEEAGLFAADAAFRIISALAAQEDYDLAADLEALKDIYEDYGLGPSTKSIVEEAERRNIPWKRLGNDSTIQLGYGKNQMRFQATTTCRTSSMAVDIAGDKEDTKRLLERSRIPVPKGSLCSSIDELQETVEAIKYPIVIKPLDANQGKGISININSFEEAVSGFHTAKEFSRHVLVEKFVEGSDYRILVINGKFEAASKRIPAHVTGNGAHTISELIEVENSNPKRGNGHENILTKIKLCHESHKLLADKGYTLESIPQAGETIWLKSTANLSTGGTAVDATDEMHPENIFMAERIARLVGLDICGIDVMAKNLSEPLNKNGGAVLEVNASPGFRMHLAPAEGKPRNVAAPVVDMLYPEGKPCRIPIIAITGTNGKTTTTRILSCISRNSGLTTGYTTTDGIYINDFLIEEGDTTGPLSANIILGDPTVDIAILETARGGILRSGLGFDQCDVA
ncbi:MAG TPA: cyanophycin synthetase, partial [Flavobacterium sp.]|nr:cyanophycin synthetase [Flavobacterium sp.]